MCILKSGRISLHFGAAPLCRIAHTMFCLRYMRDRRFLVRTTQVERIRKLATEKSAGDISHKTFLAKKRQLLEMEFLRREVDEENRRRAQVALTYRRRSRTCCSCGGATYC